jgi:para-nitrobenzyl esterase
MATIDARCAIVFAWCAATVFSAGAADAQVSAGVAVRVTTAAGVAEGVTANGVTVFRGLPYAAAPVGDLRWHAPAPVAPWTGVRRATEFGKACPQDRSVSIDQAGDPGPTSEDCLTLNVWTPRPDAGAKLPVMVWIHGGAFVIGAGSQSVFEGSALAARGVVVVTLNYRLGALGFFSHPALDASAPGGPVNFGLLDQIAALEWVRDNIASFGGDAHEVTIFGESAGAESVLALYASPPARGLFARGIAQSPYGLPSHSRQQARAVGVAVASAVGLGGANASLAELRALPADRFVGLKGAGLSLAPALVTGDAALPATILSTFQRGLEAALPLVIGNNSDEASVAVAFGIEPAALVKKLGAARIAIKPLYPDVTDDSQLGREVVRDVVFTAFVRRIAYLHSTRAPTWRYYFSRVPTNLRATMPGVPHGGEIAAVFGADDACACLAAKASDDDRAFSRRIGALWTAFARGAIPESPDAPPWPRDGRNAARTMEFGDELVVRDDFMKRRLDAFIGALKLLGALQKR